MGHVYKTQPGFTLLELAMVLFIITLILGAVLTPLSTRMEAEERSKTIEQLKEIRNSLVGYVMVNGHLPCPDCLNSAGSCNSAALNVNDGIEDGVDSGIGVSPRAGNNFDSCATPEGNLPWATLGVDQFDAWGNRFVYRVTDEFANDDSDSCTTTPAVGVSFHMCSTGNINIEDGAGNTVASGIAALVISYGKNIDEPGNPSSTSEIENQDDDNTFIQKEYTTGDGNDQFDDLLIWMPANLLIYRMVQAERLP